MTSFKNHLRTVSAMAASVMLLSLTACSTSPAAEPSPTLTIVGEGYPVDTSIDTAVGFFLNKNTFAGTVVELLPPQRLRDVMDTGVAVEAVMTPVVMRVDHTYQGEFKEGSEVTVRVFGGIADGLEFITQSAPALETFKPGNQIIMFAGELTSATSETSPALTPNFVYLKQDDLYVDRSHALGPPETSELSEISSEELEKLLLEEYSAKQ